MAPTKPESKTGKPQSKPKAAKTAESKAKTTVTTTVSVSTGANAAQKQKRLPLHVGTVYPKHGQGQAIESGWVLIDATGVTLGRLCSHIAYILMGKNKPTYAPFSDTGDHVVVINAKNVHLTGNKWVEKTYYWHTGFAGGIKQVTARELKATHPERIIQNGVWGMLPKAKGHMVHRWYGKLRVFAGSEHPHAAQKPQPVILPLARSNTRTP